MRPRNSNPKVTLFKQDPMIQAIGESQILFAFVSTLPRPYPLIVKP